MSLFGPKKQSELGIDLGAGGIKLVELRNEKGRARLHTYAFTERSADAQPPNPVDAPKETSELLKKMVQKARCSTQKAVAGLPIASVFNSVISVPRGTEREMHEAITVQARKLIPVPLEEMVFDSKVINGGTEKPGAKTAVLSKGTVPVSAERGQSPSKNVQALITAASKAVVQKYLTVFGLAGLKLDSLETETFALIRSLVGKDRSATMIVDMGALRTNIIIVENGVPYVTRSIDTGGSAITRAIGRTLAVDLSKAEQMKVDGKTVASLFPGDGLPPLFQPAVSTIVTEAQYSMNLYAGLGDDQAAKTVEKIVLTGGSALLPALAAHLSNQLKIKSYVGDPWARVMYPDDLRPVLDEVGPRFAVSVGLAMRNVE